MNSIFQSVTGMHTWDIRRTVVVLHRFFTPLRCFSSFFSVIMDVFDCCARVSCMKRRSPLELKEVHSHLLAFFLPRHIFIHTKALCVNGVWRYILLMVLHRVCHTWAVNHMRLDHYFLFTVIMGHICNSLVIVLFKIEIPRFIKNKVIAELHSNE